MGSAAELDRKIICLYNSYDIAVFSPNNAIAPSFFASSIGISLVTTGTADIITSFTVFSTFLSSSAERAEK